MTCGIYSILNKTSGKIYIGQSIDVEKRWKRHITELNHNKHPNKHLQKSWNKYSQDSFIFNFIELCSEDNLDNNEVWWIDYFDSTDDSKGYNISNGGNTPMKNKKHSLESRRKISKNNFFKGKCGDKHPRFGKRHTLDAKVKISKSKNTSGYFRVNKKKSDIYSQGYCWQYSFVDEDGFRTSITDENIDNLKDKVLNKRLEWIKY